MPFHSHPECVERQSPAVVPEAEEVAPLEEEAVAAALVAVAVPSEAVVVADPSVVEVEEVDRSVRVEVLVEVLVEVRLEVASSRECVYLFYALCWLITILRAFGTNMSSMRGRQQYLWGVATLALRVLLFHGLMER